ncbi:MAG: glycine--tRNA ligase subunit beta [Vulcanibacillus sp.]
MNRDLLLEIGLEEMPARFILDASLQLTNKLETWLKASGIFYDIVNTYSTPRRLTVIIKNVAEKQEDRTEEVKGPSLKAAKDNNGQWTKAAHGFAKGQGIDIDEIYIKEIKDIDYIFASIEYIGQEVEQLLPATLTEIIQSMTFPKNMRWGNYDLKFIRPIRWLVTLFGDKIIPIEINGIKSSNTTYGHRFLGQGITITSINQYNSLLAEQYVIIDPEERKKMILTQISNLEKETGWKVPIDEELLKEVVNLVEYPTILMGSFKEEFLQIPKEVLTTTMREHQRYFSVEDNNQNLLPYFITFRNGDSRSLDIVRKGNEKVITARLSDARFFYLEDQKVEISDCLSKLENIVFQEDLGSIGDKTRRLIGISEKIANLLNLDKIATTEILRTAEICKFDLVTNMVYEFPELQGFMGEKYSIIHGESKIVSKGIYEHYLPRFSGDKLPETLAGQIVSIADKLDNIVGSFSIGKIPTGSQDPLGLRRQAAGIIRIILEKIDKFNLRQLFDIVLEVYEQKSLLNNDRDELLSELYDFFILREQNLLQDLEIRYDVIDAVLAVEKADVKLIVEKSQVLSDELVNLEFKEVVDSFTRVINISSKTNRTETNPDRYEEPEEMKLYQNFVEIKQNIENIEDSRLILHELKKLKEPIDDYFNKVMVMTENDDLRQQRLGLLLSISRCIQQYADFNKLVFS